MKTSLIRATRKLPGYPIIYKNLIVPIRHRNEIALIKGNDRTISSSSSIVLFTVHKCASVFTKRIFFRLGEKSGLLPINIENYCYHTQPPETKFICFDANGQTTIRPSGYVYAPVKRLYENIRLPDGIRVVLILRDPRDVLTSHYFSQAYNHRFPDRENPTLADRMKRNRIDALNRSIDEHVLRMSDIYFPRYEAYCNTLFKRRDVLFVKYEEMIQSPISWIGKISNYLNIPLSDEEMRDIMEINRSDDDRPRDEDAKRHIRQKMPGDYKRKLNPGTIKYLNEKFGRVLRELDYPIDSP